MMWPHGKWAVVKNGSEQVSRHWTKGRAGSVAMSHASSDLLAALIVSRIINGRGNTLSGLAKMRWDSYRVQKIGGDPS